jgi:hypothetical protein
MNENDKKNYLKENIILLIVLLIYYVFLYGMNKNPLCKSGEEFCWITPILLWLAWVISSISYIGFNIIVSIATRNIWNIILGIIYILFFAKNIIWFMTLH